MPREFLFSSAAHTDEIINEANRKSVARVHIAEK
jgi:hypothetical protein